jgi:hypothetical protein
MENLILELIVLFENFNWLFIMRNIVPVLFLLAQAVSTQTLGYINAVNTLEISVQFNVKHSKNEGFNFVHFHGCAGRWLFGSW